MADNQVRVNDIGTALIITIKENGAPVDISLSTVKRITLVSQSGAKLTKDASFTTDGTDGKIQYITILNDLSEAGPYSIQGYIEMPDWKGHSDIGSFQVYPNL